MNNKNFFQDQSVSKKYKKILNNLLNISYNDSCIFANVNNKDMFDVYKKFGDVFFNQILEKPVFTLALNEIDDFAFVKDLEQIRTVDDIILLYQKYNEPLPSELQSKLNKKQASEQLSDLILLVQKNIEIKRQKNAFKWKLLINEAQKLNQQSNLWPIHLGLIYVTLKVDNKIVQAPLFLKEVNIKIKNSKVYLVSVGDLKINEKLLYFLESHNYVFDLDFDYSKMNIEALFNALKRAWSQNLTLPESLKGAVPNYQWNQIENEKIQFWPGITLGFFEPTGGHLRKIMTKILEENLLDEILEIEFDKNIYKKTVQETIKKQNFGFYKIVPSNLSQDKAVVSALNQNTIIWGPPGTGKSQTITNILTNVLVFGKTALVVSQKKAALEVLKQRMKALEIFCLFILNDREMNKATFYQPIQAYLKYLENFDQNVDEAQLQIISPQQKELMQLINYVMSHPQVDTNLMLYTELIKKNHYQANIFANLLKLDPQLKYDFLELKKIKPSKINRFLTSINHLKPTGWWKWGTPKEIRTIGKIIKENLLNVNLDLDLFMSKQKEINLDLINQIHNLQIFSEKINPHQVNDDQKLKSLISQMIFAKMRTYHQNNRSKYSDFAVDVRSASLDPIVFIKKHAEIIKLIYPVIITTPETDLQSWKQREFDYALLDESSQIYLEKGLPILYLAKIKILAGDDQQMQPSRWFTARNDDLENPFGNIESLLDYAIAKGTYAILLDKNYRSNYASLMTFNSQIFYHGELDVVDWNTHDKIEPIEVINANGVWENSKNVAELELMIEQTLKHFDHFEKIILLCFNASQQNALESIILESYPQLEHAINSQKLLVRNIENIQGDEADLLIASVAYDKNTKLHATYVAKSGGKNALNVAISRAKTKMIIIKSIYSQEIQNPNQSPDISIFKEWLRFLDLSENDKKNYVWSQNPNQTRYINHGTTETKLDNLVQQLINQIQTDLVKSINNFAANIEVVINYSVGSIKMPMALLDKKNGNFIVGIYLDTFKYFNSYDQFLIDLDIEHFFFMKNYFVVRTNALNWNQKKNIVSEKINQYFYQPDKQN